MTSNHSFENKRVALAGRFKNTRAAFAKELEALGARPTKSVSNKTDYFILGSQSCGASTSHATLVGAIILTEEEARAIMRGETIDTPGLNEGGDQSLDELIGEARSLLAQPPSAQIWRGLTLLFEDCSVEHHEPLTHYIHEHTATWSEAQMAGLCGRELIEEDVERDRDIDQFKHMHWMLRERCELFRGELRVAPFQWKGELLQGVDSPKFRIIRAISLDTNSRAIVKALSSSHLVNLTHLDLRAQLSPTPQLMKALCNFDWLSRLTHLRLGSINEKSALYLRDHTSPGNLTTLDVSGLYYANVLDSTPIHDAFISTPLFRDIETLAIEHFGRSEVEFLNHIATHDAFPKLRELHITDPDYSRGVVPEALGNRGVVIRPTTLEQTSS